MKKPSNETNLVLECQVEDLTEGQNDYYDRHERQYENVKKKIGFFMKNCTNVVEATDEISVLECNLQNGAINNHLPGQNPPHLSVINPNNLKRIEMPVNKPPVIPVKPNTIKRPIILPQQTPFPSNTPGSTYYVMDPNLGLLVGTLGDNGGMVKVRNEAINPPKKVTLTNKPPEQINSSPVRTYMNPKEQQKKQLPPNTPFIRVTNPNEIQKIHNAMQQQTTKGIKISNVQSILRQSDIAAASVPTVIPSIPSTSTYPVPSKTTVQPKHFMNSATVPPELAEVAFNRNCGKTFPSLVVCAKPCLLKTSTRGMSPAEREALDAKVKSVLMFTPSKLTEWLIQLGLVRAQQYCQVHFDQDGPVKLKLGIYSETAKFPFSGGYVWISTCCPSNFISVFTGSLFDEAPYSPSILLKLIYHWACQTNIQNIVQWVKVETPYIKSFYTLMRSICTAAVHDKSSNLGGPRKRVELGVISLGTTTGQGQARQVKVEVVGILDCTTNIVRLCACEPQEDGKDGHDPNGKRRFLRILEHLPRWVDKRSYIQTDYTIDKATLLSLGFTNIYQTPEPNKENPSFGNSNIMDYLRKIVPKMFQNTLSMLSIQIIQQFLDELSWRERWGPQPPQAFENILHHIAQLTRIEHEYLLNRLHRISVNPFRNWAYSRMIGLNDPKFTQPVMFMSSTDDITALPSNPLTPVVEINDDPYPPAPVPPNNNYPLSMIDMLPPSIKDVDPPALNIKVGIPRTPPTTGRGRKRPADSQPPGAPKHKRKYSKIIENMTYPNEWVKTIEEYYYAQLGGDQQRMAPFKRILQPEHITCVQCSINFPNNISLMRHLSLHARNRSNQINPNLICRYCLKESVNPRDLVTHIDEVHKKIHNSICRICHLSFANDPTMIQHMKRIHVFHEMPYECKICKFKSSLVNNVIDHYYTNHINLDTILCPFCLKILMLHDKNGKVQTSNIRYYIAHLDKHIQNRVNSCRKCLLKFVNHEEVKRHLIEDHQPNNEGGADEVNDMAKQKEKLEQACLSITAFMGGNQAINIEPIILEKSLMPHLVKKTDLALTDTFKDYISVPPWLNLKVKYEPWKLRCYECNAKPLTYSHFKTYHSCRKCEYSTFCENSMLKHQQNYHGIKKTGNKEGRKMIQDMYCSCGFKSKFGDKIAKHLLYCYHPEKSIKVLDQTMEKHSATFPPLVSIDDDDEPSQPGGWLNYPQEKTKVVVPTKEPVVEIEKGPQSMLNILGLVRKSTDETSSEKGLSDID